MQPNAQQNPIPAAMTQSSANGPSKSKTRMIMSPFCLKAMRVRKIPPRLWRRAHTSSLDHMLTDVVFVRGRTVSRILDFSICESAAYRVSQRQSAAFSVSQRQSASMSVSVSVNVSVTQSASVSQRQSVSVKTE